MFNTIVFAIGLIMSFATVLGIINATRNKEHYTPSMVFAAISILAWSILYHLS